MRYDLGDNVTGRVVNENDNFRLVTPRRTVSGFVRGVYPHSPKNVIVQTVTGEALTVRVSA